jgi:hypothetical protein
MHPVYLTGDFYMVPAEKTLCLFKENLFVQCWGGGKDGNLRHC